MLLILSILFLFITPLVMLVIRLFWPDFAYHWLIAATGSLIAFPLTLLAGRGLPQMLHLVSWNTLPFLTESPTLLIDRLSWPFALALMTLALAVILSEVARASQSNWVAWAESLVLSGLGILAVVAGNPLTLMLGWTAIDIGELLIMLSQVKQSEVRERVVITFSTRVLGIGLLLVAMMVASSAGDTFSFETIPSQVAFLMLLAAGLRLGVLPMHLPFLEEIPLRRGMGTTIRLVPAAASLVVLVRIADAMEASNVPMILSPLLLVLASLAAVYGAVTWTFAKNELDGRPSWILGMASFSVACAILGEPSASLSWGIATLLSGGLIFLYSARDRRLSWLPLLGLLGISALPYSPTWNGTLLFTSNFNLILILFFAAQVFFLIGYAGHSLQEGNSMAGVERWVWFIYPFGLALLPIMLFLFGVWTMLERGGMPVFGWLEGLVAVILATILGLLLYQRFRISEEAINRFQSILSLNWLYRSLWMIYRTLGRSIAFISTVFEGEGGLLWTLLLLVLFLLMRLGISGGGG
jgi:hypothetical protein